MPAFGPVSQCRTTVRAPDSATATYDSSFASATPLAKASPSRTVVIVPSRSQAEQPAGPRGLDEVDLPVLDAVLRGGVGEPDRAVGRDGGVVAEDHPYAVDAVGHCLDPAGAGVDAEQPAMRVADQEPPVGIDLDAERAAGGLGDPVDLGAVGADPPDRAVLGAGEDRPLVRAVGRDDDVLGARAGHGNDGDAVLGNRGVVTPSCWRRGASRGTPGPRWRRRP